MKGGYFIKLLASLTLVALIGAGCQKGPDAATVAAAKPQTLNIWAVVDDVDAYKPLIDAYQAEHPHITINYKRFRLEEYEDVVLNAMAEDRGPDVFLIHNTWIGKYIPKLEPMPASTKMVYTVVEGTIPSRTVTQVLRTEKSVSIKDLKDQYPDTVAQDVIREFSSEDNKTKEEKIVALPMSVDTLAMYVNKDMLNSAGIPTIPDTWDKVQAAMPRLTKADADGNIVQAGAALGASGNIERPVDIISVLMMQNGTQMVQENGYPSFALMPQALSESREVLPAIEALRFYLDFADQEKNNYSWNEGLPSDLDMFVQGRLAFFFGYAYHLPLIKARAPKMNLAIAKLPQIDGNPIANYANYWVWTVSKKSKYTDTSWNFINYLVKPENEKKFLDVARRPPAHKSLIEGQLEDEELAVFASQVLTAKSWYRGADPQAMETAFDGMITAAATTTDMQKWPQILRVTQDKVTQSMVNREP